MEASFFFDLLPHEIFDSTALNDMEYRDKECFFDDTRTSVSRSLLLLKKECSLFQLSSFIIKVHKYSRHIKRTLQIHHIQYIQ